MITKSEDSSTAPKTYSAILNRLLNNKKTPAIAPLFEDGNFMSDYSKRANLFNNFFASVCTPIKSNSVLPTLFYKSNTRISSFHVSNKDILSIMKLLDSSKSKGYDNVSVKMVKKLQWVSYYSFENYIWGIIKKGIFLYIQTESKSLIKNTVLFTFFLFFVKYLKD